ncbi:MAG: hypothetical protein MJ248_02915 [Bacilli bacterium]|nr:hypothetical protein [Bacilli bacterium]
MTDKIIVIDTLGSDEGAESIILGALASLNAHKDLSICLIGPKTLIESKIKELRIDPSKVEIVDTEECITNYENPMTAIMSKPNSSLVKALKKVDDDNRYIGLITAGNSGAIIMGSARFLLTKDRTRPCMAACLPNAKGSFTCVVDTGATIDVTAYQLVEFAKLGSEFMKKTYKIPSPKVGLLSNGAEPTKGNKLVKEAHPLLKEVESINFVGNIEGNKALSGDCDVLVCDGFAGNQVLKNTEGTAKLLIMDLIKYAKVNNKPEYMDAAKYLMSKYDISTLGAAIVLGIRKPILKIRGNSSSETVINATGMLLNFNAGDSLFEGKFN